METKAIFDEGTEEDSGLRKRKEAEAEYEDETWQSRLSADYAGREKREELTWETAYFYYLPTWAPYRCDSVFSRP